jgi:hypothetical protein
MLGKSGKICRLWARPTVPGTRSTSRIRGMLIALVSGLFLEGRSTAPWCC